MIITSAKYVSDTIIDENKKTIKHNVSITANIDGETMSVPLQSGNRHYDEIVKQVTEKTLTIEDAD